MAKEKSINTIVSINRATQMAFELKNNELAVHDLGKSKSSKEFYVSYIPFKDIMITTVEVPRTVEEDDIPDSIVIKVYEELGLEASEDYKITYMESNVGDGENRFFNVFVVNNTIMTNDYAPIANQTSYIDYMAMAPFLPSALYKRGVLPPEGVECFIYLQREDAFLVVYQNGEYFQSRQLRYNLKYIHDKFSELAGARIDEEEFYNVLSRNGINFENPADRDYIIQIFDDIFFYIGDIVTSLNKIYNLSIKSVYFGSDIGRIPGVEAFVEDRLKLNYKDFNFNVATNSKDFNMTQLDTLMMLLGQDYLVDPDDEYNYSPFRRPPPLSQRKSGKLLGIIGAALVVGLAYPAYQYGHGFFYQKVTEKKTEEFNKANAEVNRIKNALADLANKIKDVEKKTKAENDLLTSRKNLLDAIYDKKKNYPMKSKGIYDITDMVNNKEANIVRIVDKDKNLTVSVRTKTDKKMTELIKDISSKDGYSVMTRSIVLDENNQSVAYESNISVEMGQ